MALKSSRDVAFLLVAGRNILGVMTSLADAQEAVVEETTALGSADDTWTAVGLTKWALEQDGFYDSGAGGGNEALSLTGEQVLMYGLEGNTIGADFLGVNGVRSTNEKGPARDALTKAKASYKAERGPERGHISAELAARTTAGPSDTTSDDWGTGFAPSTNGGAGYLGVTALALDGGTSITVVIRHSSDNISFADLITFANVTAAPAAERKTVAGSINRYTLTRWTFNGAAGAARSATFATALARY